MVDIIGAAGSIAEAIWGWIADTAMDAATELSSALTDELIKGLLIVPNPSASSAAAGAWNGVFEISLVLLPIMIALALIAWPFSEKRESGLMELIVRTVMVLFFIGVSQPAWGFAIDATNAVTVAILDLNPSSGGVNYGFGNGLLGSSATYGSWAVKFVVSIVAAILAILALLLSTFFLLLRWFMVWMAYIGAPFFAVVWFVGRGPFQSVGSVGGTFLRMGVFSLLAGPVIAILVLTFQVIEHGGILQTAGSGIGGNVGLLFAELGLMLLFPILLIVTIWKLISWAGQPIGAGEAAGVATMAVTAAVGGAVAGVAGGSAGGVGSAAGGSSGGGAAGSSGGAASAGSSGVGGSASAASGSGNVGAGGSGLASRLTSRAKGGATRVKQGAHQMAMDTVDHYGTSQKLSEAQSGLSTAQADEQSAGAQAKFIQNAMASEEMDMAEANEQGFLNAEPIENQTPAFKTDPDTLDKKMSYVGTDGAARTVNLSQKYKRAKARQRGAGQHVGQSRAEVSKLASQQRRVNAGKKGVKRTARVGAVTTKTGAAAMIGGVGGNSYLAHSMGRRATQPMIGSNTSSASQHPNHRLSEYGKATAGSVARRSDVDSERSGRNRL